MDRCMITHSLLSSWQYAMRDDPNEDATSERNPYEDFLKTLRREPTPTSPAMQNGIDFEDLITAILTGQPSAVSHDYNYRTKETERLIVPVREHKWFGAANEAASRIRGGILQLRTSRNILVGGEPVLLYGRLDCLRAGEIIDIKFSKGYDRGKYFSGTQHPTYLELVPEATKFTYLISNGSDIWTETYLREDTHSIIPVIADFFDWLRATDLMGVYQEKWLAK